MRSHSRGTLTLSNALKALNTEDNRDKKLLSGTTIKMVGPAADKGWIARISDIFGDNSSVHNCYGLGQRQCVTDGYRTKVDLKMGNEQTIFNLNKSKGE